MCLLLFYVNPAPGPDGFHLILVNVRDEVYQRPTKLAAFWDKNPNIIGGMDLEPGKEGGTWLAVNKNGKMGALLNILQPDDEILPGKKGRGFLAVNYVTGHEDCSTYLQKISDERNDYNGFLLVTLDFRSLQKPEIAYFTNATTNAPLMLEPGIHAFGNSLTPETPWPKVLKAKEMFTDIINSHGSVLTKDDMVEALFKMLKDPNYYQPDDNMKKQGKSKTVDFMKKLSSIFVKIPEANYGSRCHTVVLIDQTATVDYYERSRKENVPPDSDESWVTSHLTFKLNME